MHCCVYVCVSQLVIIIGYNCHTHFLLFNVVYFVIPLYRLHENEFTHACMYAFSFQYACMHIIAL